MVCVTTKCELLWYVLLQKSPDLSIMICVTIMICVNTPIMICVTIIICVNTRIMICVVIMICVNTPIMICVTIMIMPRCRRNIDVLVKVNVAF